MLLADEDLEAGTRKKKIHTETTLPIYLKVTCFPTQDFPNFSLFGPPKIEHALVPTPRFLLAHGLIGYYLCQQAGVEIYVTTNATH